MAQPWQQGQAGFQYPMQTGMPPNFQQQSGFSGGLQQQPAGFPQQRPGFGPQPTGFQQPQQGFQQQPQQSFQQPQPGGFQQSQPTGFQQQPSGFQQPQQTGFVGNGLSMQPTGFQGGSGFQHRQAPMPPPVPPIPSRFQGQPQSQLQPPQTGPNALGTPQPSFLSTSPGPLLPQQTGFVPSGGLVPQMTGFMDPRLQMMGSSFMPANISSPYTPAGMPQFAPQAPSGLALQQSIQQHNQAQRGTVAPRIPWALSKAEKKQYDQIFRAWDAQGTGFIDGSTSLQVFGQSGLPQNDMARIWALADQDDRGKLNLAEFHVAMGLIYRRLNGVDIPERLPPELVPPSSKDLGDSVDILKHILKDGPARSTNVDDPVSRAPARSFSGKNDTANTRKDGTIYRHNEDELSVYKPPNRHLDRNTVRTGNESPSSDLNQMRRQLENASKALEKASMESASRTAEDDALDREMDELRDRVKYVQEELEYVSRGPRSFSRDEDRRKLERDLLHLMHDRIPELERKIEDRERRKAREKEDRARSRDYANSRESRFSDERDRYSSRNDRPMYRDEREDRGYLRGTFDDRRPSSRNEDRYKEYGRRERSRDREYDREYDRGSSYTRDGDREYDAPRARSPPTTTRSPPPTKLAVTNRPTPPAPSASPRPDTRNMTSEERAAFIREQAQRRLQDRMIALGVVSSASNPSVDTSVEDRLQAERKEAEEKAKLAEKEAEERERVRQERLQSAKGMSQSKEQAASPTSSVSSPQAVAPVAPVPPPTLRTSRGVPPPPPAKKAPAPPPPLRNKSAPRAPPAPVAVPAIPKQPVVRAAPAAPVVPIAPVEPEEDPGEKAVRERMEALKREREKREARLRELEELEAEERRAEVEYQERRKALLESKSSASRSPPAPVVSVSSTPQPPSTAKSVSPIPPAARSVSSAPPPPAARSAGSALPPPVRQLPSTSSIPRATPSPPVPPPAPPAPPAPPTPPAASTVTPSNVSSSPVVSPGQLKTNPFSRLMSQGSDISTQSTPPANQGGTNPFTRPQAAPTASQTPPPVKAMYPTANDDEDEDWGREKEDDDDSSDEEFTKSRNARDKIAQQLFGGLMPTRTDSPGSPTPGGKSPTPPVTAPPAPPVPPAPAAPPAPHAPAAPPPPPAPVAPMTNGAPPAAADRGALFGQIAGGMPKLRKATTNDRSAAAVVGNVLGDTAPPSHIPAQPRPASPPPAPAAPAQFEPLAVEATELSRANHLNRQSVDWYANMAADGSTAGPHVPSTVMEEEEEASAYAHVTSPIPDITISAAPNIGETLQQEPQVQQDDDAMADIDLSKKYRVRTLYPYQGERPGDLNFGENVLIDANPSKSGGEWWYGTLVKGGTPGFFPGAWVQEFESVTAKALYAYAGNAEDELSFEEGDTLVIIERSESDWWKAEKDGAVFIVPSSYLEVLDASVASIPDTIVSGPKGQILRHDVHAGENTINADNGKINEEDEGSSSEESDEVYSDESSEWLSFDEGSDDEPEQVQTEEQRLEDKKARERERQRVLEAAGLVVRHDGKTPPRPPARKKSVRAPDRATRRKPVPERDLPPLPQEDVPMPETPLHLDDAFERYQSFKQTIGNRLSITSSIDSGTPSMSESTNSSPGHRRSLSKEESRTGYSSLLSFLGRRTPAAEADKRPLNGLIISGPILNTPATPSRENSPGFGASWSSLVDKTALEGIPPEERRRQEAIFELILTESAYIRNLQLIVEVFYSHMMTMLDQKAITVIFANVEDILLTNTVFLSSLEERQKDCRLYVDNIGDIIEAHMSRMGVYMQYCVNTSAALKILQSLRNSKPELASYLQRLRDSEPSVRGLDLASYLLNPMQRITRYPLLLRQILGQTQHQPEHGQIDRAIAEIERILEAINEDIRQNEGRDRLRQISQSLWVGQGRLDLTQPTRFMGQRRLIKEGPLWKSKSNRRLQAFLCSDILILTNESASSLYRMPIPLSEIQVQDGTSRQDLDFKIALAYPRGGDVIHLRASSAKDARDWMKDIERAHSKCVSALKQQHTTH